MSNIEVLFENSRDDKTKGYGPGELLIVCVADDLKTDWWSVTRRISINPRNGVSKLIGDLDTLGTKLAKRAHLIVAVIDDDKVRRHLGLPADASRDRVIEAVRARATCDVAVVLLDRNTETLVAAAARAIDAPAEDVHQAIERKQHLARDRILTSAAHRSRNTRDAIRREVPTFDELVKLVAEALR